MCTTASLSKAATFVRSTTSGEPGKSTVDLHLCPGNARALNDRRRHQASALARLPPVLASSPPTRETKAAMARFKRPLAAIVSFGRGVPHPPAVDSGTGAACHQRDAHNTGSCKFNDLRPRECSIPVPVPPPSLPQTRSPSLACGRNFSLFSRVVAGGLPTAPRRRRRNSFSPGRYSPDLLTLADLVGASRTVFIEHFSRRQDRIPTGTPGGEEL